MNYPPMKLDLFDQFNVYINPDQFDCEDQESLFFNGWWPNDGLYWLQLNRSKNESQNRNNTQV
jgi:hypothetical protein